MERGLVFIMNSLRLVPVLFVSTLLAAIPALAVNRSLEISAPAVIRPGLEINVVITAATEATDTEQIAFLHTEYSLDGGKTWVPVYAEKLGRKARRTVNIPTGGEGSKVLVRVRAAFRGGQAGDVDFAGKPILWEGSWGKWETPPAKTAEIAVKVR